ncbi:MAG: thioredoxin family protein [Bacteroidetes bacterium]|nr:MAG: thioredoxin family protein [Bacteroidota bacterium]
MNNFSPTKLLRGNRKKIVFGFLLTLFSILQVQGQLELPEDKVQWKFRVEQNECEATIIGEITMVPNWHIYALYLPEGSFSIPTKVKLEANPNYELVGKVTEPKPHFEHDEMADEDLYYHSNRILLKQKIKILSKKNFQIKGTFSFQTCDDTHCLPPYETEFTVQVKACSPKIEEAKTNEEEKGSEKTPDQNTEQKDSGASQTSSVEEDKNPPANEETGNSAEKEKNNPSKKDKKNKNRSLWVIFAISFGSGFLALLTPCVFPMIPMTVSFFTKQSKTKSQGIRNAIIYAISIIAIYILLGVVITAVFGASSLNEMSTNPWFNLFFFALLIVFAVSFMGAFEIRLPNSWINKADSKADKGGFIGIFFMALVLALVSFSCTGPIVGSLIVEAASVGGITPIVGMFGFSLALALPFALFAAFPGWLNSMPQSGGWLNTVKVVLGFLELALAFKFLSNADLAWQSHFLERELFIAIWIGVFAVLALYLFGKITLPHDTPIERLSVGRTLFGTLVLVFVIYMLPGMWGAPLKLINAFPPPNHYAESPLGVGGGGNSGGHEQESIPGTHLGPQNIMAFHDYDDALAYAKQVNKPLFVDFTGWNCVNCRKMEQGVWGEPGIIDILKEDVIVVSLHVDERTELPKEDQKTVDIQGKKRKISTVGDKWMLKQINEYNIAAQPYYIMQSPDGKDLNNGSADYQNHRDPAKFQQWLKDGLTEFKKNK